MNASCLAGGEFLVSGRYHVLPHRHAEQTDAGAEQLLDMDVKNDRIIKAGLGSARKKLSVVPKACSRRTHPCVAAVAVTYLDG